MTTSLLRFRFIYFCYSAFLDVHVKYFVEDDLKQSLMLVYFCLLTETAKRNTGFYAVFSLSVELKCITMLCPHTVHCIHLNFRKHPLSFQTVFYEWRNLG